MQSLDTEADLVRLLMGIAKAELSAERARQFLANQPLFEPYAAFQRIDRELHGIISSDNLKAFLRYKMNIYR